VSSFAVWRRKSGKLRQAEPADAVGLPCILGEQSTLARKWLAHVGIVDVAVLGLIVASGNAFTQYHPGDVQHFHDLWFSQRLIAWADDATVDACLFQHLSQTCLVRCFVRLDMSSRVNPDAVFAVVDEEDAPILDNEA
jgi:hypothetical protein